VRKALVAVMLAGCWTAPRNASPLPAAPEPAYASSAPMPTGPLRGHRALPIHTVWEGHYFCSQGKTFMRLTLDTNPGGEAVMMFEFGPLPENPPVPTGSYQLIGTHVASDDGSLELELTPDKWIVQPPGYVSVSISAEIDSEHQTISGKLNNANCGELEGKRVD